MRSVLNWDFSTCCGSENQILFQKSSRRAECLRNTLDYCKPYGHFCKTWRFSAKSSRTFVLLRIPKTSDYPWPLSSPNCALPQLHIRPQRTPSTRTLTTCHKADGNDHLCYLFCSKGLRSIFCGWRIGWVDRFQIQSMNRISKRDWVIKYLWDCTMGWWSWVKGCKFCLMKMRTVWLFWWKMSCGWICNCSRINLQFCRIRCFSFIWAFFPVRLGSGLRFLWQY